MFAVNNVKNSGISCLALIFNLSNPKMKVLNFQNCFKVARYDKSCTVFLVNLHRPLRLYQENENSVSPSVLPRKQCMVNLHRPLPRKQCFTKNTVKIAKKTVYDLSYLATLKQFCKCRTIIFGLLKLNIKASWHGFHSHRVLKLSADPLPFCMALSPLLD